MTTDEWLDAHLPRTKEGEQRRLRNINIAFVVILTLPVLACLALWAATR